MADIVDYYKELDINKEWSLDKIHAELAKLERVWHQREINQPEKARKMLMLLDDAHVVFETDETRAEYDQSIEGVKKRYSNMDDSEQQECIKHYNDAEQFYNDGQFDLAKICIDKAVTIAKRRDNETQLNIYSLATGIYIRNELFVDALNFINQKISLDPECVFSYSAKADILISLIEEDTKQNHGISKYVSNYRKTCEIWMQKALVAGDNQEAAKATVQLGKSYLFALFGQLNFDLVEKYADQALKYNPENTEANQMLCQIETDRIIDKNGLNQYRGEQSQYIEDIERLAEQISLSIKPECELGWVLTEKKFKGFYEPDNDGINKEEERNITFALSPDGKFMKYSKRTVECWGKRTRPFTVNRDEQSECGPIPVMTEMDIDANWMHSNGKGLEERGNCVEMVCNLYWIYYNTLHLTRKYRKKGQGLYNRLKEIVDKEASYIEECDKINAEYNKELEPMKQEIADRYAIRRNERQMNLLRQERERKRQEEKRQAEENRRKLEEQKRKQEREKKQEEERKKYAAKRARVRAVILYIIGWLVWGICMVNWPASYNSYNSLPYVSYPKFMATPLFLIISVIGTAVPAYADAAYQQKFGESESLSLFGMEIGRLGIACFFSIIMNCFYSHYVDGVSFFPLLIVLIVLQIISRKLGDRYRK